MPGEGGERAGARWVGALGAVLLLVYPVAVYFGLEHVGARAFGLGLAVVVLAGLLLRLKGDRRDHAAIAARAPLTMVVVLLFGALFDDRRFVLALPVLTNGVFLAHFAWSLRSVPVIERFARVQEEHELTRHQIAYCRTTTIAWCIFFVVNGAICGVLALFAPLAWWTLYTGLVSYVFLGVFAAAEYVIRKATFRKFSGAIVDRALSRLFPPLPPLAPLSGPPAAPAREVPK